MIIEEWHDPVKCKKRAQGSSNVRSCPDSLDNLRFQQTHKAHLLKMAICCQSFAYAQFLHDYEA